MHGMNVKLPYVHGMYEFVPGKLVLLSQCDGASVCPWTAYIPCLAACCTAVIN